MAENTGETIEQQDKLVLLSILDYYDDKIKQWVIKRITDTGGIGNLTKEELSNLIHTEVDNYNQLEII